MLRPFLIAITCTVALTGCDTVTRQTEMRRASSEYMITNVPYVAARDTTPAETCMGSTSAGDAMVGVGFSSGTTWRDSACVRRLDAQYIQSIGYSLRAKKIACDSANIRAALRRIGRTCDDTVSL